VRPCRLASALALLLACAAPRPGPAARPAEGAGARALQGWANGAVFYQVFVRSFQDSDGDGKGDLRGLVSRLDYLNDGNPATGTDLGVDALWLMPVLASPSYHGYDTTDYDTINPDYGTNADFSLLCTEAHKRGMRIVIDLVLNHTSASHPWFVDSSSSPTSPRRDWYVWSPTDLGWRQPWNPSASTWHQKNGAWYYGLFWRGMPDLNFRTPAVREEAKRIAALWLGRGADGFRLDASRHLIETGPGAGQSDTAETHRFWKEFAAYVRGVRPDAIPIGENWTETPVIAGYYGSTDVVPGGDELPLNFDFPLARRIVEGVLAGDAAGIGEKLLEVQRTYPLGATDAPFLTNHDQRRVASELKNDPGRLWSAAAVLITLPGSPFIYYGEEVGLENGTGDGDEAKRTPMPWDATPGGGFTTGQPWYGFAPGQERANVAAQTGDPDSLLSHYRDLVRARHASPALARGRLDPLPSSGPVLVFLRTQGDERVLVAHNLGGRPASAPVAVEAGGAVPLFAPHGAAMGSSGGGWVVALPPHGSAVFRLQGRHPAAP
jgi:glycosidase